MPNLRCAIYGLLSTPEPSGACSGVRASSSEEVARTSFCASLCEAPVADGLLEVLSPPTLGMSANNGDDSSFELCAIAFFFLKDMDKEVRENGVGIRSLIAAWSVVARAAARAAHDTGDAAGGARPNFFAAIAGSTRTAADARAR